MAEFVDLTNQRFGSLQVIKIERRENGVWWRCRCDCGNEVIARSGSLKAGNKKSCGCKSTRLNNLSGKRFGYLTVIERKNNVGEVPIWKCECDCGKIVDVYASNLRNGNTKSCGCMSGKMVSEKTRKNLSGKKFGNLYVLERLKDYRGESGYKSSVYKCLCDCGNFINVRGSNLTSGHTTSCGCNSSRKRIGEKNFKHGLSDSKLHVVWQCMKSRCYYENSDNFEFYGGRGITICDEWLGEKGFENFAKWAYSNGYDEEAKRGECTIDRINPDGDYCPSNCRWITSIEQANNRRSNINIEYKGRIQTLMQWCREYNSNYNRTRERLKKGWDFEEALFAPKYSVRHKK